jgi:protein SCO1/2
MTDTSSAAALQKYNIKRTVLILVGLMGVFVAGFFHKILSTRILNEHELSANGAIQFSKPRIIAPFALTDINGQPFTLDQLKGKWTVVFFGFTSCPDICPVTLSVLNKWYTALDKGFPAKTQVVMITVDPERDTPDALRAYLKHFNPNFIGVTGELASIRALTDQLNVAFNRSSDAADYSVDHSSHLVLINPYGHYHGIFTAPFELSRLKVTFQSIVTAFE